MLEPEISSAASATPNLAVPDAEQPLNPAESPLFIYGTIVLLALIWGSSFILMKRGSTYFSPLEIGALRLASAGLFVLPLGWRRFSTIDRKALPYMLLSGLLGSFLPSILFATASLYLSSAVSGSLNALSPLFTLLLGLIFFGNRTPWTSYIGILLGLAGAIALSLTKPGADLSSINPAAGLIVLATLMYALNINLIKRHLAAVPPLTISVVSLVPVGLLGAIVLLFATPFTSRIGQPGFWDIPLAAIVSLGVFGTGIGFILFNRVVKVTTALQASSVTYLMPVVAIGWGLLDGERIYAAHYVGLACILAGLLLVSRKGR